MNNYDYTLDNKSLLAMRAPENRAILLSNANAFKIRNELERIKNKEKAVN